MTAEILNITPEQYHQLPHLSSSLAKVLLSRSPRHARELRGKEPTPEMDFGNVGHRLVLGKGKDFAPLPYEEWRTNEAKKARDDARKAGLVPIKQADFERANTAAESVRVELLERGLVLDGESELAVTWTEETPHGPVTCRAMFDHAWIGRGQILDLKFTGDASSSAIERNAENMGYALQRAAYVRAMTALRPDLAGKVDFLFAFAEASAPHAVNLVRPDSAFCHIGERRWERAVHTWAECLATGVWPAYGGGVNTITVPSWALYREAALDESAA